MRSMRNWVLVMLITSPLILSFSHHKPGGEGYEIYLNDKVFTQRFGNNLDNVTSLPISSTSVNDKLVIKYHHCGRVGKNRIVTIKDGKNNTLKEFRYADGTSSVSEMTVPVKELINLKGKNQEMKMYYTSTELPKGRMLLLIKSTTGSVVSP